MPRTAKRAPCGEQRPIRPVGPDGPLSWVVALACSWNLLWSSLVRRSTGVIYVALVRTFGATREQTSWVLSVGTSLAWLIGPIIGAGTRHIPLMVLSFLGATITAVSAIGCAFARDMTVIFFLLGVCSGIGNGIGMPTNDVTVAKYFRRYRGSGNGVYYAGGTLAAFAFPPIMNLLLQEYGFLGTFLITGGLMLNAIAACPFYRAPPWEKKRPNVARKKVSPEAADTSAVSAANRRESAASVKQPEQVATINGAYQAVMQADTISVGPHQEDDKKHLDKCSKPSLNSASILQNCEDFALYADGSSPDPNQTEDVTVVTESDGSAIERATKDSATATYEFPPPSSPKRGLSFSFLKRKHSSGAGDEPTYSRLDDNPNRQNAAANISGSINSAVPSAPKGSEHSLRHQAEIALYGSLDTIAVVADDDAGLRRQTSLSLSIAGRSSSHWAYLRSPVFYMVCLTCAVSVYNLLVLMILVDLAMEKGFTRRDGAVFLSVSAIGDASARLVAGVLSDRAFCDRRVLMGTSALLAGALCVALPHMHVEYYALAAVMCLVFGWSNGTVVVLFAPVLADQLGVESLGLSSGTCRFVMGVAYLACPKITGYFKDEVGSYDGLLYMVSIGAFFVGIMWTIDYVYRLLKSRTARSAR